MSDVMNHVQFADQVNDSGATRQLGSMERAPASGFYVSRKASEGHEKQINRAVTPVDVAAHRAMALHDHPSTRYQGGWNEEGTRYLDVSDRYTSFHQAVGVGRENKQVAIRDAGRSADVYINHGPRKTSAPTATSTDLRQSAAHIKVKRA